MQLHFFLGSTLVALSSVHAGPPLQVCEVLDRSNELNNHMITVRGFLSGSPAHGYSLFASPSGTDEPCPGWRREFLTAPAVIELGQPIEGTPGGEEYRGLSLEMSRRYQAHDYSTLEVVVKGRLHRKWLLFINKHSSGAYIGNGYGQNGGRAAILQIASIRKVFDARSADGPK